MAKDRVAADATVARSKRVKRQVKHQHSRARGRTVVGALLIGCVLVASAVIWRRSYGFQLARELGDLDRHRAQLDAERARLRDVIRDESSRLKLGPVAEQLGMRVPSDKQVRILPR